MVTLHLPFLRVSFVHIVHCFTQLGSRFRRSWYTTASLWFSWVFGTLMIHFRLRNSCLRGGQLNNVLLISAEPSGDSTWNDWDATLSCTTPSVCRSGSQTISPGVRDGNVRAPWWESKFRFCLALSTWSFVLNHVRVRNLWSSLSSSSWYCASEYSTHEQFQGAISYQHRCCAK